MSLVHGASIPKDNLALYLDPGNIKSYPGSGSTWYDLSGNGNHATLYASPIFHDNYVTWNGSTQYAEIVANQESLDFKWEQTICMWLNPVSDANRKNPWDQGYGGYGTWTHESSNVITYYYGNTGNNNSGYKTINSKVVIEGVWTFVCTVRNNTNVKWYSDGSLYTTDNNQRPVTEETPITTSNIRLGRGYTGWWIGKMGHVMAFTRALSAEEIAEIYRSTKWRYE